MAAGASAHNQRPGPGPWSRRGWRRWLVLLALGLALKVLYVGQYLGLPFVDGPIFDSQVYLEQADALRCGRYADPTLLAFSPLYGWFLVAIGAHAGLLTPIAVQLALGLVNAFLLGRLTTRLFGPTAGLFAGIFYLLYGPLLFFETKIMSETLGLTLLVLALDCMARQDTAAPRVLAGIFLSLAVLARASLLPCLPCFFVAAALRWTGDPTRKRLLGMLGLAVGLALPLVGNGLWNLRHAGVFVPVIFVSSTAATATRTRWDGGLDAFRAAPDRGVGPHSVLDQARDRLRRLHAHEPEPAAPGISIGGWLRNAPGKAWLTLRDEETSLDYGYYGERSELWALCIPFVRFGAIALWAALGLWLLFRAGAWTSLLVLAPVIAGVLATTTLFHPSSRYRLPIVLALIPLAAHAWACALRHPRRARALAALAIVALGFGVLDAARGLSHPAQWQLRVAEAAATAGDLHTCRARVERARTLEPADAEVAARIAYVGGILPRCVE